MNEYYDYNRVVIETPEERLAKNKKQMKLFSRVFLALFIYTLISQFSATAIYTVAATILSPEKYEAFADNYVVAIIVSSVVQYLIAFPVFVLMLLGTDKAQKRERKKISARDFILTIFISQALMFAGSYISEIISSAFENITGKLPENDVDTMINEVPIYLIFIVVVILAPIVEELIFRKMMIDRLSIYGDRIAIIFTAVSFGLIHANLYQLFYATLLGFLLGYVYTKTRDVKYTILIHMIINFLGSIVVLPVQDAMNKVDSLTEALVKCLESGDFSSFDYITYFSSGLITVLYANVQYGMIIGGGIALWHYYKKKAIKVSNEKEIYINDNQLIKNGVSNVGTILFIAASVFLTLLNLIIQ